MASNRLNAAGLAVAKLTSRRMMSSAAKVESVEQTKRSIELSKFDPKNYSVPFRAVTMDDYMEPYGSWKTAYAAESKRANRTLISGMIAFTCACITVYYGGVFDGVILPNLDNIMEETEPWNFERGEGRVTVYNVKD